MLLSKTPAFPPSTFLQDLNSSNGTTLNSTVLSPYKSFDLRDGNTFKLEELTSILVQVNVHEETSQLRRNPRRRVNELSKVRPVAASRCRRGNGGERGSAENWRNRMLRNRGENRGRGRPRKAKALEKELESAVPAEAKRRLGMREASFLITNKVEDNEQVKRYLMGVFDFQASALFIAPLVTIAILNIESVFVGVIRIFLSGTGERMLIQVFLSFYILFMNYAIVEGMIGRIPSSVTLRSTRSSPQEPRSRPG
ncbi:hypothetical protein NC652_021747 [Populus alba x Populus x berolinensis]|nr:hypothetical protein NC652_021747 [Populus alba x Populus x berolinensis]